MHRYLALNISIVHIVHECLVMLQAGRKFSTPQRTFIDGFTNQGILISLGLREDTDRCLSLLRYRVSTLTAAIQVSSHHIEIQVLAVLQVQLIINVERRDICFCLLPVFHLIHPVLLIQDAVPVGKGVRNILDTVAESDVQHTFFAVRRCIVE